MKKLYALVLLPAFVFSVFVLHAQTFKLVKDINRQTNSYPANAVNSTNAFAVINGKAYFAADDGVHGKELWSSDGTAAGTKLVIDISPGVMSSYINCIYSFNNKIYFLATADNNFSRLYISDGMPGGTSVLKDSLPIWAVANYAPPFFAVYNNTVYFTISNNNSNCELWKTDGTIGGTVRIIDFSSGPFNYNSNISSFTIFNNKLFFTLGLFTSQLWCTDGTTEGTRKFNYTSNDFNDIKQLAVAGNKLYILAGSSLWSTTGDSLSTRKLTTDNNYITGIMLFKNNLYCTANNTLNSDYGIYKYDALAQYGLTLFKQCGKSAFIQNNNDSLLYFSASAQQSSNSLCLWVTDGNLPNTINLLNDSLPFSNFFISNKKLYFSHTGNNKGEELWLSDGSVTGTKMVTDINAGIYNSSPSNLTQLNDNTLFAAKTNNYGIELWKTNGTATGTALVKDINVTANSGSYAFINYHYPYYDTINNRLITWADDGIHGYELWGTDGTAAGTTLLKDIVPGPMASIAQSNSRISIQNKFKGNDYFFAASTTNMNALWKTQGTPGTTSFVSNVLTTEKGISPQGIYASSNNLYIIISSDTLGTMLYAYNGNGEPLLLKKGFESAYTGYDYGSKVPQNMMSAGQSTYFFTTQDQALLTLWKTDGTINGTAAVKTLYPSQKGSQHSSHLISFKNQLFFMAFNGYAAFGSEPPPEYDNSTTYLWKSDGTDAGTSILKKVAVIESQMVISNNKLFFVGKDSAAGQELWVTDGTTAGTHIVKDIRPGTTGSQTYALTDLNGVLYFMATDGINGMSLYKTDGTEAGTIRLINKFGPYLIKGDDKVYFTNGYNIWESDGTAAGTKQTGNLGLEGLGVQDIIYAYGRLYAAGDGYYYGRELYSTQSLLPVSMLSFTAQLKNTDALLQWATENEQNNSYFNIQRSLNGNDFTTIGRVNALGNIKENDYNYTDAGVTALGVNKLYYRLQQFDVDGKFTYSKTIPLTIPAGMRLQVGPNPAVDVANIYSVINMQNALITVTDMSGRVLYNAKHNLLAGSKTPLSLRGYAKGVYTLSVQAAGVPKQEFKLVVGK